MKPQPTPTLIDDFLRHLDAIGAATDKIHNLLDRQAANVPAIVMATSFLTVARIAGELADAAQHIAEAAGSRKDTDR